MKFSNLKIGTKLGLAFSLIVGFIIISGAASGWQVERLRQDMQGMGKVAIPSIVEAGSVRIYWNQLRRLESELLVHKSVSEFDRKVEAIAVARKNIEDSTARFLVLPQSSQEIPVIENYLRIKKAYFERHDNYLQAATELIRGEGTSADSQRYLERLYAEAEPEFAALAASIGTLSRISQDLANEARERGEDVFKSAIIWLVSGVALSVIFATVFALSVTRSITSNAKRAVSVATQIADGDLRSPIDSVYQDEMGQIMRAMELMRSRLENMVRHVHHNAVAVSVASEQISSGTMDLSARTEEQASALEETAASMEQLATSVQQNAEGAVKANQLALNASAVATEGGNLAQDVSVSMAAINESSGKIADIIGVIDAIAFQTNILALNAAVEAARAGDQGRGFAVVAAEVRTLAQRSAQSAREIKALIHNSLEIVSQSTALVARAGGVMSEAVTSIRHVTDFVGDISATSLEQSQGVTQVSSAIAQMDVATQQNAALVEESAAAAAELSQQAKDLMAAVSIFKTRESETTVKLLST